jgi:invasion protein IalB
MRRLAPSCVLAIGLACGLAAPCGARAAALHGAGPSAPGAAVQPGPAESEIGSWVLACPATSATAEPCILRHRTWVLRPGPDGPVVALEVQMRGGAMVPVVTLRGLPVQAALGGSLVLRPAVALHFDNGPGLPLGCGLSGAVYACAPEGPALAAAAAALADARSVTLSVTMAVPGVPALVPQERTMALAGTRTAIARLRAAGAMAGAVPSEPGLDLPGLLDGMMHAAGFRNGIADVLPMLLSLLTGVRG